MIVATDFRRSIHKPAAVIVACDEPDCSMFVRLERASLSAARHRLRVEGWRMGSQHHYCPLHKAVFKRGKARWRA